MEEIEVVKDPLSDAVELEKELITLRDKRFPIQQEISKLNHEIEQLKSKIKILNHQYWHQKG